eukprot:m.51095 g.51095  ORF g.51095 m.51095 type:complete len:56 (-) comp11220_c0_seq1:1119-1286(-)
MYISICCVTCYAFALDVRLLLARRELGVLAEATPLRLLRCECGEADVECDREPSF